MTKILGVSAFYHDSAAALAVDGKIVAAASEERFSRKKQDPSFPLQAARYCLDSAQIDTKDLDAVVFYDKPLLKFERLLESQYHVAPKGLSLFVQSMPVWLKEKLFLRRLLRSNLKEVDPNFNKKLPLLFTEHHLSHAASAFYPSPFNEAAILTIDGVGEWATSSWCHGQGADISVLKEMHFPDSIGLLYSSFTWFLGFRVNSGEYKLMGLAPYGDEASSDFKKYRDIIRQKLIQIFPDGSIKLNKDYFQFISQGRLIKDNVWEALFSMKRRRSDEPVLLKHANLALAIQRVTEEIVYRMALRIKKETGSKNLCLAGGVALNSVCNGKLQRENIFENIWVQPAAGDAGGALGAALAGHHIYFNKARTTNSEKDSMSGAYLGPEYSDQEIEIIASTLGGKYQKLEGDALYKYTAEQLANGKIVGWFQGRMEFGPRALGNRSILADPRVSDIQRKLNIRVKFRESFRPFAPAILEEDAKDYFEIDSASPYMLFVHLIKERFKKVVPWNYNTFKPKGKLYTNRSDFQGITHVDWSARIQTVSKETNPIFHGLISAFKEKTGCPILVNTSFNLRSKPIVCSPEGAYRTFMHCEMDTLVMGNYVFEKKKQVAWDPVPIFNTRS
ncbi:MAG: carbamoyltransferase [Limisphaerales bacterium]|jgi:carbamoyltransferase